MQYLYDKQHYIDLYDLSTIKACIKIIQMFQNMYDKSLTSEETKDLSKREKYKGANQLLYWHLSVKQANEYVRKKETIDKWMAKDRLEQEKYDHTPEPQEIYCPDCKSVMRASSRKHLENYMDTPMRMIFLFRCTNAKCEKQEWVYDNGEVRVSPPDLCPKCNKEIKVTVKSKGQVITTKRKCSSCGFADTDIEDLGKGHEEYVKKEKEEKALLARYREAFCLTDEMGKKYIDSFDAMEFASQVYDEEKRKYDNNPYEQVSKVKKLGIVDLEKLLSETLEQEKYIKFSLDKPEMDRFVIVPFTAQDSVTSRRADISTSDLQKLIKDTLEGTNWRLMSESIDYRLGYVSGRLKGYEREDDLLELYGKKKQKKQSLDEEKLRKYSQSTWVQLARLKGEQEGIEAIRKRRLEKEPEGFFLEGDGYYNCAICYEGHYGNEIWWNLDGIRCADCWRNIKEGVIPSLKEHLFDNDDEWISTSQLKDRHNIHPSSVKKLRREGLLHGRDLKRENGSIYETIYLVSENQKFLKKYPPIKEKEDSRIMTLDVEGHAVQIATFPESEKK